MACLVGTMGDFFGLVERDIQVTRTLCADKTTQLHAGLKQGVGMKASWRWAQETQRKSSGLTRASQSESYSAGSGVMGAAPSGSAAAAAAPPVTCAATAASAAACAFSSEA